MRSEQKLSEVENEFKRTPEGCTFGFNIFQVTADNDVDNLVTYYTDSLTEKNIFVQMIAYVGVVGIKDFTTVKCHVFVTNGGEIVAYRDCDKIDGRKVKPIIELGIEQLGTKYRLVQEHLSDAMHDMCEFVRTDQTITELDTSGIRQWKRSDMQLAALDAFEKAIHSFDPKKEYAAGDCSDKSESTLKTLNAFTEEINAALPKKKE